MARFARRPPRVGSPRRGRGREVAWAAAAILAMGVAAFGALAHPSAPPPSGATATPSPAPFALRGLDGRPAALPAGPVVVEAMATWCEYCATTAKWLDAGFAADARRAGAAFALVDVSPLGGLGVAAQAPTPASIQATAQDGSMAPLHSNAEVASALQSFVANYELSGLPAYFVPLGSAPPADWRVTGFPTFVALDARHRVVATESGFMTAVQFQAWLRQAAARWGRTPPGRPAGGGAGSAPPSAPAAARG
ncbi:MAG: hypothetical protein K6U87_06140 [Firmicutes bacterium]|nr:hypothetical protein [Bacillota bacterium]